MRRNFGCFPGLRSGWVRSGEPTSVGGALAAGGVDLPVRACARYPAEYVHLPRGFDAPFTAARNYYQARRR